MNKNPKNETLTQKHKETKNNSEFRSPNSKLKMRSPSLADEKFATLAALFPNAVTETKNENGAIVRAIDKDVLEQEINAVVVDGGRERYQFTWSDKCKSILLANAPIAAALRPCRKESVDFDNTENLYIEGDNLDVLKLLRETYLNKVKMIYIDPPYNTGNDFVYNDDFDEAEGEFLIRDGYYDDDGNRMRENKDSNGRFHTDWLNMIYPRLRIARDLLTDDGVIFISIDYNENYNCRTILNEIFGASNFIGEIYWESKTKSQNTSTAYNKLQPKAEMILVYAKQNKRRFNLLTKGSKNYPCSDEQGEYREYPLEVMNASGIRGRESMVYDVDDGVSTVSPPAGKQWQLGQAQVAAYKAGGNLFIRDGKVIIKMRPDFERGENTEPFWGFFSKDMGTAESAKKELSEILGRHGFETTKPVNIVKRLALHATEGDDTIMDFFSGSATTAHAVMQLNAEDGGRRKFIMVQILEVCDEKSEAFKAGFKNICEIGKERIRRAGDKIKSEILNLSGGGGGKNNAEFGMQNEELKIKTTKTAQNSELDAGFRVLKLDSSNMEDVYYTPEEFCEKAQNQPNLDRFMDNIKEDRSDEDLLFQVMLELGIPLSAKIKQEGDIFYVNDNYLIACFKRVDSPLITKIAKCKPNFAVFRDSAFASDSAMVNFDQIFNTYSPDTVKKVL
jgi:adenine-specific DNA-methyltransferase